MSRSPSRRSGTVRAFDDTVGLGTVVAADGTEYGFHCIEIADGTRTIEVGSAVTYSVLPRFGTWQAADITPA
ncbi:MAG TPA: hypothetical protein VMM60_15500 [Ilumatobacter sp.]|nr:hypothetical protein [Ilumatobacter sp.]